MDHVVSQKMSHEGKKYLKVVPEKHESEYCGVESVTRKGLGTQVDTTLLMSCPSFCGLGHGSSSVE